MNKYGQITALYSRPSVGGEDRDGGKCNSTQNQNTFLEAICDELKPIERCLPVLKKHIEQADINLQYKSKKALTGSEQIKFTAARNYPKGVMNGKATLPTKAWKAEYDRLTAGRNRLNQKCVSLKSEVKEVEKIRKSLYSMLRQEQRK